MLFKHHFQIANKGDFNYHLLLSKVQMLVYCGPNHYNRFWNNFAKLSSNSAPNSKSLSLKRVTYTPQKDKITDQISTRLVILVSVGPVRELGWRSAPVEQGRRRRRWNHATEDIFGPADDLLLLLVHQLVVGSGPAAVGNVCDAATRGGRSIHGIGENWFFRNGISRIWRQ